MYQLLGDFRQKSGHEVSAYVSWRFNTADVTSQYRLVDGTVDLAPIDLPKPGVKAITFVNC